MHIVIEHDFAQEVSVLQELVDAVGGIPEVRWIVLAIVVHALLGD